MRIDGRELDHRTLETIRFMVKAYVASTDGRLTLHFLPGYAPDLNPDEAVWSHMKRTARGQNPVAQG